MQTSMRDPILTVALKHQLISPYTSFVAVEEEVFKPPSLETLAAPTPSAAPLSKQFPYPNTATGSMFKILIATLVMLLVFIINLPHIRLTF